MFFSISRFASASDVSLKMENMAGEIFLKIKNESNRHIYSPGFAGKHHPPLILVFSKKGHLIPDKYWSFSTNSQTSAVHKSFFFHLHPNDESTVGVGFELIPDRFTLSNDGYYYVLCILKKGEKISDGLWFSNILSLRLEGHKIVESFSTTKTDLPPPVQVSLSLVLQGLK
jgi:hypothetical protein